MTKPASTPILAVISTLPVLLGATEARAVPYEVTIVPEGTTVVATSNEGGDINTNGLTQGGTFLSPAIIWPSTARVGTGSGSATVFSGTFSGPTSFGTGGRTNPSDATGASTSIALTAPQNGITSDQVIVPFDYVSQTPLGISTATFPGTFASLGLTPGTFTWTWGGSSHAPDQSFTINVVPGPIVGAGLPGLIAALGGLVAMARRRRRQLA